jgi:CD63 antigen
LGFVAFCDQLAIGCVSLLQLCGLAILIAGALTYAHIHEVDYFMDKVNNEVNFAASPIALMVVGSIVFVVAFYGCCGAIRESHCMLVTVRCTFT